jgi:phosphoglycerol transferase
MKTTRFKSIGAYTGAFVLCCLILVWVMKLWQADLKVPFDYGQDALYNGMIIKGVIDNGWYLHNDFIGMPTGLDMHDFNNSYFLHFLTLKLISFFFPDYFFRGEHHLLLAAYYSVPLLTMVVLLVSQNDCY